MYRLDTSIPDTATARVAVDLRSERGGEEWVGPSKREGAPEASGMSNQRSGVLELAVLGLLHETPMHGYELRKRLNSVLGAFRAFGYGSLYPCLKELLAQGLIAEDSPADTRLAGPARPSGQAGDAGQARP